MASLSAWFSYSTVSTGSRHSDLGQNWFAARMIADGVDPYPLVGPGRQFDQPAPLLYPLTAAVVTLPFARMTEPVACATFVFLGALAFAWCILGIGYSALWAFASFSVLNSIALAQWSLLLTAAIVIAPLSFLYAVKPTLGAALFIVRPTWWPVVGGAVLLLVTFLIQPHWLQGWSAALSQVRFAKGQGFPFVAPIAQPGGVLILTALTRWRRAEARIILALACVPHTILPYETVALFLIPRGSRQVLALVVLSYCVLGVVELGQPYASIGERVDAYGQAITLLLYLPATILVLRRPNAGPLSQSIERRIAGFPAWLKGASDARSMGSDSRDAVTSSLP
jgi:hypothetical protein